MQPIFLPTFDCMNIPVAFCATALLLPPALSSKYSLKRRTSVIGGFTVKEPLSESIDIQLQQVIRLLPA
jgi:hypothetical protein